LKAGGPVFAGFILYCYEFGGIMTTSLDGSSSAALPLEDENLRDANRTSHSSFIDRFLAAVSRLPFPYWVTYLTLFILESLFLHVASWMQGWLPLFKINPILFLFPLWLWGPFIIITYLNSVSLNALSGFASLMDISESELAALKDEFTNMPTSSILISGLFWILIYALFTYVGYQSFYVAYGLGRVLTIISIIVGLISYSTGSIIYYHSIRQLRLVHRTMKMVRRFNLFQLDPVYSFSQVTSRTGIAWVILLSLTLLTFPLRLATIPVLFLLIAQVGLAITAFVLPLRVVHHELVLEKRRLLAEHQRRVESALNRLHHSLEEDQLGDMLQLNNAINGLNSEHEILNKIPTWPWRAGMLKDFLSIVVLPIILFLVQLGLGRWLGK
jgi:hypothetical protein